MRGIPMPDAFGSRKIIFGFGDKLNALQFGTQHMTNITETKFKIKIILLSLCYICNLFD